MERSVEDFCEDDTRGKFLQVSGIQVTYDLSKPSNSRVVKLMVASMNPTTGLTYSPVDPQKNYTVVTNSYLIEGGNGYKVLKNNILDSDNSEILDIDVIVAYMKSASPVKPILENRINFVQPETKLCSSYGFTSSLNLAIVIFCGVVLYAWEIV